MIKKSILTLFIALTLGALSARAAKPLNVAGVDVDCTKDVTITASDIKSGTVTYTKSTNTLTLTNATITRTGSGDYCIHNRSQQGLIVKFVGTCKLTAKARVIRMQCGGGYSTTETPTAAECQLVATSGAVVTLTSTGDGAIYVRDFTALWIKGPGTFNITGNKDGAIAGHGSWNSNVSDLQTVDLVKFSNVTATVTGAQSCLLGLGVQFYTGSDVTFKASGNSSYPVARQLHSTSGLFNNTVVLAPWGAEYNSSNQSFVLNGSNVYNQDVYVSDNYALLLNATNFPDANFRTAMLSLYPKGYLTTSELQNLTSLDVSGKSISNLMGVTKLTYLKSLNCYGNKLTSLPTLPSGITYLRCNDNQLTSLPTLPAGIRTVYAYGNKFTSLSITEKSSLETLNVSDNTALKSLYCFGNALTTFTCSGCTSLQTLDCSTNKLTSLGTLPTSLTTLKCFDNKLTSLPVLPGSLTVLECDNNQLTALPTLPAGIQAIYASSNKFTSLSITEKSSLETLNVSDNTALKSLYCFGNALTTFTCSGCTSLQTLDCSTNKLTSLGTLPTSLTTLKCFDNKLTSLPVLPGSLTVLECDNNQLTALPTLPAGIQAIYASSNKFTSLSITEKSSLNTLDVSNNTALESLICYSNALTSLNYSGCTNLSELYCFNNKLTSLPALPASLTTLNCRINKLTSLPTLPASLTELNCNDNQLSALPTLPSKLTVLYCANNKLTSLSVQGCNALKRIECYRNQIQGAEMTALVNSLPYITGSKGMLDVLYNSGEGNEITAAQVIIARDKGWVPNRYDGIFWVAIATDGVPGDVNGDGIVNGSDVTALYNYLLNNQATTGNADVNGDGNINGSDVTALYNLLLK